MPKRRFVRVFVGMVLLAGVGVGVWYARGPDRAAAARANARGVGHMEQFEYDKAAAAFAEAARLAPGWTPARINLGIALYNAAADPADSVLDRAAALFEDVLKREPDDPHAHFNLGTIRLYQNRPGDAAPHFEAVTRVDPSDAFAWYQRGNTHPGRNDSPEAKAFFRKALDLDPYLNAARYALATHAHDRDEARTRELLAEHKALAEANWETEYDLRYSLMGKYAAVIGDADGAVPEAGPPPTFAASDKLTVTFAAGAAWAKPADGRAGEIARRFGRTMVRLDYDGDGRPDLLLLGAVERHGTPTDLLLRNEGGLRFADVLVLPPGAASSGCAVGDFDNDGRPDLLLTGPTGVRLLRNDGGARFVDVTAAAGIAAPGERLGSAWVDLDQDGDLDALAAGGSGVILLANVGEAPPGQPPGPLTPRFRRLDPPVAFPRGPATSFVCTDLDDDGDVDVIVLTDAGPPVVVLNDRLMRFRRGEPLSPDAARRSGGLVLDSDRRDPSDLLLTGRGESPAFLLGGRRGRFAPGMFQWDPTLIGVPPLVQAQAADLDFDGFADAVGLSESGWLVLLHGNGRGRLDARLHPTGGLWAVAAGDLDGDGRPELLAWGESGLTAFSDIGHRNNGLRVELTGRRDRGTNLRTNADGVGSKASVLTGVLRSAVENTTLSAGLGQSRLPLEFGLGRAAAADAVRVRWPDGVVQAEMTAVAGTTVRVVETNRKGTSCPVLLAWNGAKYEFITDFLGGGALGELGPDGTVRPPRPEESVRIRADRLVPRAGKYAIKIAEPMDEVLYLDHLRLDVVDAPAGVFVLPEERFAAGGPPPTQELLTIIDAFAPVRAADHRGRDVTDALTHGDGRTVDGFLPRSWLGFAEDHFIELDFGDAPRVRRVVLVLAGWTDYPYPESIYAASQAGVAMVPPVLERFAGDRWEKVCDLGFPAGLPKVMTHDLPATAGNRFRIRTNLQIYWDQVLLADVGRAGVRVASLPVARAALARRGLMREVTPPPGRPVGYDDDHLDAVPTTRWKGRLTRTGEVTPLLTAADDRFVVCGPGDEIAVEFDAAAVPPPRRGETRSFVLRTAGYCKDTAPFTRTGGRVGPLPFRGMGDYPDPAGPADQAAYDREWNTRPAGR